MLKVRVIPTLLFKSVGLVKGVGFNSWRRTGDALQAVRVYNMREVDEIVFMDISATPENSEPDYAIVDDLADECFMPMTVGGGIRNIESIRKMLSVGADKVLLNTAAFETPELIRNGASTFGSQCIVVAIDAKAEPDGHSWRVYTHGGRKPIELDAVAWAREVVSRGAGEILLTSMDRDGTKIGFDLALTRSVSEEVEVPVIASGGVGTLEHLVEGIRDGKASAVLAASIFHFGEFTVAEAKQALAAAGIPARL